MWSDEILILSLFFSFFGKKFDFCLYLFLLCRWGIKHFYVHFWRIRLVLFPSKHGKDATYEESASFVFIVIMINVLFPICTLTWRVNAYNSRKEKSINGRNESAIIIMIILHHGTSLIE